jgi:hypothetical protein
LSRSLVARGSRPPPSCVQPRARAAADSSSVACCLPDVERLKAAHLQWTRHDLRMVRLGAAAASAVQRYGRLPVMGLIGLLVVVILIILLLRLI